MPKIEDPYAGLPEQLPLRRLPEQVVWPLDLYVPQNIPPEYLASDALMRHTWSQMTPESKARMNRKMAEIDRQWPQDRAAAEAARDRLRLLMEYDKPLEGDPYAYMVFKSPLFAAGMIADEIMDSVIPFEYQLAAAGLLGAPAMIRAGKRGYRRLRAAYPEAKARAERLREQFPFARKKKIIPEDAPEKKVLEAP